MKIYIAGKMTGIKDHNFPLFNHAAAVLRAAGHEVFNPADLTVTWWGSLQNFLDASPEERQDGVRRLLAAETRWICLQGECVCLLPGWEDSPGARAEKALAEALKLKIMYFDGDEMEPSDERARNHE